MAFTFRQCGLALIALTVLVGSACTEEPKSVTRQTVIWRPLGSWTGQGDGQTGSFTSDTGSLRLRWETSNEQVPNAGTFHVTLHSAISGRPLLPAVDHQGVGRDTAYLEEDPRVFYFVVESASLDWSIAVDEGIPATVTEPAPRAQSH